MPIYIWTDKKSKKSVEILRPFDEYNDTPDKEEALKAGLTAKEIKVAKWEKIIGGGIRVIKSDSWGQGKGFWVLLIGGIASWIMKYLDMNL